MNTGTHSIQRLSPTKALTLQYQFVNIQLTSFQNNRTDAPIRSPIPTRIPIRLCPILSRNPAFLRYVTLVWLSMWWPGASGFYQNFKYKPQTYLFITVVLSMLYLFLLFTAISHSWYQWVWNEHVWNTRSISFKSWCKVDNMHRFGFVL